MRYDIFFYFFPLSCYNRTSLPSVSSCSGRLTLYTKPTAAPSADGFYREGTEFEYHLGH